ncbi:MAG TPA: sigma-54 dependent transcriptional regulator [Polyangiaceae bacterium]|nr:sigma-54 dependent transcriptional regulator [Polyangiaceae bacterium]
MPRILVVDDDRELLNNVSELLVEEGFEAISASNGADAVALAKARAPDLVVCDIAMPIMDGYQVLSALRSHPATSLLPFIFLSARAERNEVRAGMNLGADDYVTKPFQLQELLDAIRARLQRVSSLNAQAHAALQASGALSTPEPQKAGAPAGVVLLDPSMQDIYRQLEPVAHSQLNVLVLGETGSGKEVLARSLHDLSPRRAAPFLPLNCAALNEQLLEAELFGHEKGAFTGAAQARPGLFETAHGGTVFLDEVGELPLSIQTKLLRVLEDRKILRVGGRAPREVDVRFVAATNRNLKQAIADRMFREDLFYRLNGMSFTLPPLRARRAEIRPLCQVFATRACVEHGRPPGVALSESALGRLEQYAWPGNVRELKNVIERAVVLCQGTELGVEHLPPEIAAPASAAAPEPPASSPDAPLDPAARLRQEMADLERDRVLKALEESGGNQGLAAERLGMSRRSLVYRLSAFGLTRSRKK